MFQHLKNIDSAFKHIRVFSILFMVICLVISGYAVFKSYKLVNDSQKTIYILANGKALEAFSAERKDNIPVEARDHIKMFHLYFCSLSPDEKVIQSTISKALYLADKTAKIQYDNLKERGYYANIISGNISQEVEIDSIQVDINSYPFHFICYATQKLVRSSSVVTRSLITEGYLRNVSRSDNNPHGFLIEKWATIENKDQTFKNR